MVFVIVIIILDSRVLLNDEQGIHTGTNQPCKAYVFPSINLPYIQAKDAYRHIMNGPSPQIGPVEGE